MVETLQALPGVQCTVAVTMVAAVGDLSRFDIPRALMKCLGLIPSAYSSGARRQQGAMTNAGHTHARRALVEGAWAYRDPAKVSRHLPLRLEQQPKVIQDLSWKAQVRLCQRDRRLVATDQQANVVTVAMARALVGFLGAMAQEVPVAPSGQTTDGPFTSHSEGLPTCMGRGAAPMWCHPRQREEAHRGHSSLDRGRHPTDARQVGANPRIAAGSTVGSSWLRLFRCTEDKKHLDDLKKVATNSCHWKS